MYRSESSGRMDKSSRTFAFRRCDYSGLDDQKRRSSVTSLGKSQMDLVMSVSATDHHKMASSPSSLLKTSAKDLGLNSSNNSIGGGGGGGTVTEIKKTMVDIAGVRTPLRNTQETVQAVAKDYYSNISCYGCSMELCCIADVSYVLCPDCKIVSPMGDETLFEGKPVQRYGLGMGFTYESLFRMQVEIMQKRGKQ